MLFISISILVHHSDISQFYAGKWFENNEHADVPKMYIDVYLIGALHLLSRAQLFSNPTFVTVPNGLNTLFCLRLQ